MAVSTFFIYGFASSWGGSSSSVDILSLSPAKKEENVLENYVH